MPHRARIAARLFACLPIFLASNACAYGWLTHWRVLDETWPAATQDLCPGTHAGDVLKNAPEDELLYWAGVGAVFYDIGYVLKGLRPFSDRAHYIGTGAFTDKLTGRICRDYPNDPKLLAFAVGVRSHYWADRFGHYYGTNVAVARILKGARARVVYEENKRMHREVELGTFGWYDLEYGSLRMASRFVGHVGDEESAGTMRQIAELVRTTLAAVFESSARLGTPNAKDLHDFTVKVASVACHTVLDVYGDGANGVKNLYELLASCKTQLSKGVIDPKGDAGLFGPIFDGAKLHGDHELRATYDRSIGIVESALKQRTPKALPDFNLDTNLPSASGQYHLADAVYATVATPLQPATCDEGAFFSASKGLNIDWRKFQAIGACAATIAAAPLRSAVCSSMMTDTRMIALRHGWLRDIDPAAHVSGIPASTPVRAVKVLGDDFQIVKTEGIQSSVPTSRLEFLFACSAIAKGVAPGHGKSAPPSWMGEWLEAKDRLKTEAARDPLTGLLK